MAASYVTRRSLLRRHSQATRVSAAIVASLAGMGGAAWSMAHVYQPFHGNAAKAGEWNNEDHDDPLLPIDVDLPTLEQPAEDIALGDPSAWRSDEVLLKLADSLNSSNTPAVLTGGGSGDGSGSGSDGDGDGNDGDGNFWIVPPGLSFGGGDGDDGDDGLDRPDWDPGRDATMLECVAATLDTLSPTEDGLPELGDAARDAKDEASLSSRCEDPADEAEEAAPAESDSGEQPAEGSDESGTDGDGGDPATSTE